MTTTRDHSESATSGQRIRDLIATRATGNPAWSLVLAQYDDGLAAYPQPFVNRSPA